MSAQPKHFCSAQLIDLDPLCGGTAAAGGVIHTAYNHNFVECESVVIGRYLNLPVVSKTPEEATDYFVWMARFVGLNMPASSALT